MQTSATHSSFQLRLCLFGCAIAAFATLPVIAQAQSGRPKLPASATQASARAAALSSFNFPLEPGDVLAVAVANHPEMNAGGLSVNEAGKITLPVVGNVSVAGKLMPQVQKIITAAFASQLRLPQVSVTLVRAKPRQITLIGALAKPGPMDLVNGWRIGDAIDAAGGLTVPTEDIVATFSRNQGMPQKLDLAKIIASPQSDANLSLKKGDSINLKPVPGRLINVLGDVKTPGLVMLRHQNRLLNAIVGAGGLPQKPETTEITLVRANQRIPISVVDAFNNPDEKSNVELKNGDLLNVKAIRTTISVVSLHDLVKAQGSYTLEGKTGTLRALLTAGGLTVPPDQAVVSIRRGNKEVPVNIEKATYDPSADVALQNGDILLVSPLEGPKVKMAGSFVRPGELNLKKDAFLLDAIFTAGGPSLKPDSLRLNILRSNNGKSVVLSIDPVALIGLRDLGQNVRLQDGDLVMANPQVSNAVFVSGEVEKPGEYQIRENDGIVELLLRAGGPNATAALKQISIVRRDGTSINVDVSRAFKIDMAQTAKIEGVRIPIELQQGDLIVVPRNPRRILVMEAVARPGYYPIPETGTLTLGDALLMAGGTANGARLQEVAIVRRAGDGGVSKRIVPINQLKDAKFAIDEPLSDGDVVYVPQGRAQQSKLNTAISGLSILQLGRSLFGF